MRYCHREVSPDEPVELRYMNKFNIARDIQLTEDAVLCVTTARAVHLVQPHLEGEITAPEGSCASTGLAMLFNDQHLHPLAGQLRACGQPAQSGPYNDYVILHLISGIG